MAMVTMSNITDADITEAREFIIQTNLTHYIENGMTPEGARNHINKCLDAPWDIQLPSIDEL